jgi:Tfp pilus assembly protein PilF
MEDKTVRDAFLDTVLNQLETGDPPQAKATFDRLIAEGNSKAHSLQLIAAALRTEMQRMLSEATPFDNERYAALLAKIKSEG